MPNINPLDSPVSYGTIKKSRLAAYSLIMEKLICHGTRNMGQAGICIRQYACLIEKLDYPVRLTSIRLVTASAVGNIKQKLDLASVAKFFTHAQYEPELFNVCMLKVDRLNFYIFSSGKIVVTGIKELKLISQVVLPTMLEIPLV